MNQQQFVRLPLNNRLWSFERTGQQWQQILIDVQIWLPKPYADIMKKKRKQKTRNSCICSIPYWGKKFYKIVL